MENILLDKRKKSIKIVGECGIVYKSDTCILSNYVRVISHLLYRYKYCVLVHILVLHNNV